MFRVMLGLVVVLGLLVLMLLNSRQPPPLADDSATLAMLQPGPHQVSRTSLRLVDERRTVPDPAIPGQTLPRAFKAVVWYPREPLGGEAPLVLYSHGVMSTATEGRHIARHLASHGYIVAAAEFPLTSFSSGDDLAPEDVVNQPGDIRFLLDHILDRDGPLAELAYPRVDAERIAAVGLSLGGMTTHMLAFDPERSDKRIAAAIAVAAPSAMFTRRYFSTRKLPYLMIASPEDAFIDYRANAIPVLEKIPGASLVTIHGGSHTGFSHQARWLRWFDNPDSIGCAQVADNIQTGRGGDDWYESLGSVEEGFIDIVDMSVCEGELGTALNPIRQLQFEQVAVLAFLQCVFATDAANTYCDFLQNTFPRENAAISFDSAGGPGS